MSTENVCWIHWQFDELFHPYTKYCLDQSQCQQYCKEKDHDNELFKAYLAVSCGVSFFLFGFHLIRAFSIFFCPSPRLESSGARRSAIATALD